MYRIKYRIKIVHPKSVSIHIRNNVLFELHVSIKNVHQQTTHYIIKQSNRYSIYSQKFDVQILRYSTNCKELGHTSLSTYKRPQTPRPIQINTHNIHFIISNTHSL